VSVCNALAVESLDLEIWFLASISRSCSYSKVIGSRSRSQAQKACLCVLFGL